MFNNYFSNKRNNILPVELVDKVYENVPLSKAIKLSQSAADSIYRKSPPSYYWDISSKNGELDVIKWLHTTNKKGFSYKNIIEASNNNHLHVIKYLSLISTPKDMFYVLMNHTNLLYTKRIISQLNPSQKQDVLNYVIKKNNGANIIFKLLDYVDTTGNVLYTAITSNNIRAVDALSPYYSLELLEKCKAFAVNNNATNAIIEILTDIIRQKLFMRARKRKNIAIASVGTALYVAGMGVILKKQISRIKRLKIQRMERIAKLKAEKQPKTKLPKKKLPKKK